MRTQNHSGLATAGGIAAIVLWSTTIAVARSVSEQVGSFRAASAIYGTSALLAIAAMIASPARHRQIRKLPLRPTLICGLLFIGYMVALYLAIGLAKDRAQTLVVALLNYLWPPLTIIFSIRLLKARASFLLLPATVLAVTGVYFVLVQGRDVSLQTVMANLSSNPLAYGLATAAALAWALYSNLTRLWAGESEAGAAGLFLACTAGIMLLLAALATESGDWSNQAIGESVFLGLANYFAYTLWDSAMRRGNLTLVAAASYLTPLMSTAITCLYLHVLPGAGLLTGCALLVAGSIMSWMAVQPRSSRGEERERNG